MGDGGKGSKKRPMAVSQQQFEDAWNSIFKHHPNEEQFTKEEDDTPTKPKSTASNKKNLQQTQKRRRIVSRVVGRNSR
jgi:hypothetical protein